MRHLAIIPIIHSEEDLGGLSDKANKARLKRSDLGALRSVQQTVRGFWEKLERAIDSWISDYNKLSLYQDAIPVVGPEMAGIEQKIVDDLASRGSCNHQILQNLICKGARLFGTESPELLIKEYEFAKANLERSLEDPNFDTDKLEAAGDILLRRDRFIASRIDQTLESDREGILFIGTAHDVEVHLCGDILVTYPLGKPTHTPRKST